MTVGRAVAAPRPAVEVRHLVVRAGGRTLVGPVSFRVAQGATVGLQGPSGSGKSTILRSLVALLAPELAVDGAIEVLGTDVRARGADLPALRARAALVSQTPCVFPATVLANAAFGLRHVTPLSRTAMRERAHAALVEAGLWDEVADRLDAPAGQLSVGQRQRLCLARALALDPAVLLLDEPTSALDPAAAAAVEATVASLRGRRAAVVVSHDAAQLERLCDEVVTLAGGDHAPAGAPTTGAAPPL